jgi:hypothetical protein
LFRSFVPDDTWISLHYARRLLEGHGLTWVSGERVEGYSNPLFVLLCAAGGGLGFDLLDVARALGVAGFLATVLAVGYAFRPWDRGEFRLAAGVAMFVLATSGSMAAWAMGGLEAPLISAWVTWAAVLLLPAEEPSHPSRAGFLLALATLTRTDGYLFTCAFAFGLVVCVQGPIRQRLRSAAMLAIAPTLALVAQTAFRLAYFGDFIPNTARAKVAISFFTLRSGIAYLQEATGTLLPIVLTAVASAVLLRRSPSVRFLACGVAAWLGTIVLIGGDWMPAHRHMVPILPMMVLLASMLLVRQWSFPERTRRVAVLVAVLALLAFHITLQQVSPANREARDGSEWVRECSQLATSLGKALAKDDPLMAVDVAGCWPYFSRFRSIDMLGLSDRHIARNGHSGSTHSVPGHALGDGRYVLDLEPDLISFGGAGVRAPVYLSGLQMMADSRFQSRYRPVKVRAGEASAWLWVRKDGGPLSSRIEPDRIAIPALQLAGPNCVVQSHGAGGLTTICLGTLLVDGILLARGRWRVQIDHGPSSPPRLKVTLGQDEELVGAPGLLLELDSPRQVSLSMSAPSGESLAIDEIRLERLAD